MNERRQPDDTERKNKEHEKDWLNRLAQKIDPPGREPDDDELRDPGNSTPGSAPTENRS